MVKELKKKESVAKKKRKIRNRVIAVAVCGVLALGIVSYNVISYGNKSNYFKVGNEAVSKAEFDYYYTYYYSNYFSTTGTTYYGVDLDKEPEDQMYDDTLTWKDYLEKTTAEYISYIHAIKADAEKNNFEFDRQSAIDEYEDEISKTAKNYNESVNQYLESEYGHSFNELKNIVVDGDYVKAYLTKYKDSINPSNEDIEAYYNEHKNDYDKVFYYVVNVGANVSEDLMAKSEFTNGEQEQIDSAMAVAKEYADLFAQLNDTEVFSKTAIEKGFITSSDPQVIYGYDDYYDSTVSDWLYDDSRNTGDTTIIPYESNYTYQILCYIGREKSTDKTVDAHIISISDETDDDGNATTSASDVAAEILETYNSGEKTEDSFAEVAGEDYTVNSYVGLSKHYSESYGYTENVNNWLYDNSRTDGDVTEIDIEGTSYLVRFDGKNDEYWKVAARINLISEIANNYVNDVVANYTVSDTKGNLGYISKEQAN